MAVRPNLPEKPIKPGGLLRWVQPLGWVQPPVGGCSHLGGCTHRLYAACGGILPHTPYTPRHFLSQHPDFVPILSKMGPKRYDRLGSRKGKPAISGFYDILCKNVRKWWILALSGQMFGSRPNEWCLAGTRKLRYFMDFTRFCTFLVKIPKESCREWPGRPFPAKSAKQSKSAKLSQNGTKSQGKHPGLSHGGTRGGGKPGHMPYGADTRLHVFSALVDVRDPPTARDHGCTGMAGTHGPDHCQPCKGGIPAIWLGPGPGCQKGDFSGPDLRKHCILTLEKDTFWWEITVLRVGSTPWMDPLGGGPKRVL